MSSGAVPSAVPPMSTPPWLLRGSDDLPPCRYGGRRRRTSFVERTLVGGSDLLRQVISSEDIAAAPGLLQRLDARAKIVSLVLLLVAVGLAHHPLTLVGAYALALLLAGASRVPLGFFIKRVWLFIPIFTAVVVLPATLSVVSDGDVVVELWSWHGHAEGLTSQGLTSAVLVVLRVAVSVSLAVLLTLTTPWARLLDALRGLRVPRVIVLVVNMAYRYIFLLLDTVTDMYESRKARQLRAVKHDTHARATVGATVGTLVGKSSHLAEEVHQAMVARGYRGDVYTLDYRGLGTIDGLGAVAGLGAAALLVWGDLLLGR